MDCAINVVVVVVVVAVFLVVRTSDWFCLLVLCFNDVFSDVVAGSATLSQLLVPDGGSLKFRFRFRFRIRIPYYLTSGEITNIKFKHKLAGVNN